MISRIFLFFTLSLIVVACSDYNKILKGDDIQLKFEEAQRLYKSKKIRPLYRAF